jgi:ribosomal protein S18 acetylase RimI-like enzyme
MSTVIQFNPAIHTESIKQIGKIIFNNKDYALLEGALVNCSIELSRVLVDTADSSIVLGFILLKYTSAYTSIYEISFLGISPSYQGRGAGSQLLRYVENTIPDSAYCWLLVNQDNTSAQNLYSKFGFHILCECLDVYHTRCYVMIRDNNYHISDNLNISLHIYNNYVIPST